MSSKISIYFENELLHNLAMKKDAFLISEKRPIAEDPFSIE
jgi:hypothetical protein